MKHTIPVLLILSAFGLRPAVARQAGDRLGDDDEMRVTILAGTARMPAFQYFLKPIEIDAIIAYVRTIPAPALPSAAPTHGTGGL